MARKLITSVHDRNRTVKVYYDSNYDEYVARLYMDGALYAPADYFTDDRDDAIETARLMAAPV